MTHTRGITRKVLTSLTSSSWRSARRSHPSGAIRKPINSSIAQCGVRCFGGFRTGSSSTVANLRIFHPHILRKTQKSIGVAGVERGDDAAMQRRRHEGAVEALGGEGGEIGMIAHAAADEDLGGGERSPQRARRLEPRPLTAAHPGEIEHDECSYPRFPRHRAEPGRSEPRYLGGSAQQAAVAKIQA